jgi:hypothetical protein
MDDELEKVINHIGYLMNSMDPAEEINKLISMEMTLNPESQDISYRDIMTKVIIKLVEFYDDMELQVLWTEYLLNSDDEEDEAA